jgi:hypothetical protein
MEDKNDRGWTTAAKLNLARIISGHKEYRATVLKVSGQNDYSLVQINESYVSPSRSHEYHERQTRENRSFEGFLENLQTAGFSSKSGTFYYHRPFQWDRPVSGVPLGALLYGTYAASNFVIPIATRRLLRSSVCGATKCPRNGRTIRVLRASELR